MTRYARYPKEKQPLLAMSYSIRFGLLSSSPNVLGSKITLKGVFNPSFLGGFFGGHNQTTNSRAEKLQNLGQKMELGLLT